MSAPVLIYLGVTTFAVVLAVWAIAAALVGDTELRGQRLVAGGSATGMLLVMGCVGASSYLEAPRLIWGSALLPPLILAITWSNLRTVRRAHLLIQVLLLPIFIYNLLLVGIYSTWFCSECLGIGFGVWGDSLLAAFAQFQTLIGHETAVENPLWLQLPVVVPPWSGLLALELTMLCAACGKASFVVLTLVVGMPLSFARTESFAKVAASTKPRQSKPIRIHMPWGECLLDATQRTRLRLHLQKLQASGISYTVSEQSFRDQGVLTQLKEETEWARGLGYTMMARVAPPGRYLRFPAASLEDLRQSMLPVQTQAVRDLKPDGMVLFSGPYGSLRRCVSRRYPPHEWFDTIRRTMREVRPAHPDTDLIVAFERFDQNAIELFQALDAEDEMIDGLGFAIHPRGRLFAEVARDLERIQSLCNAVHANRQVHITACGGPLPLVGGEVGQWNLCASVLLLGDRIAAMRTVAVGTLYNPRRLTGLVSPSGRQRWAFHQLLRDASLRPARPGR